jgi:hypothetical protein
MNLTILPDRVLLDGHDLLKLRESSRFSRVLETHRAVETFRRTPAEHGLPWYGTISVLLHMRTAPNLR